MKAVQLSLFFMLFISTTVNSQNLTKKEANRIFDEVTKYLKTNDTTSFVNLWHLDGKPWPYHKRPYNKTDIKGDFVQIKTFMDTAFSRNLLINNIDIDKQDASDKNALGKYLIKAWYKYDEHYYKGFGFYLDFVNNKWVIKNSPETSYKRN